MALPVLFGSQENCSFVFIGSGQYLNLDENEFSVLNVFVDDHGKTKFLTTLRITRPLIETNFRLILTPKLSCLKMEQAGILNLNHINGEMENESGPK